MLPGNGGSRRVVTHDFNHEKPLHERQSKALALGELTFKRKWVHF